MPALLHQLLVDLFRHDGELVRELLPPELAELVANARPRDVSAELSQLAPPEFHADHLVVFRATNGDARLAVILEVQGHRDARKIFSWPVYVAVTRARYACPTALIVLALDPSVAKWARRSLVDPRLEPYNIVISRDDVPSRPVGTEAPVGLAVLRALAQRDLETFTLAFGAISALPEEQALVYLDAVLGTLPDETRHHLESSMPAPFFRTPMLREAAEQWWRKGLAEGLAEGKQKGLAEGKQKGLAEGKQKGLAEGKQKGLAEGKQRGRREGKREGLADAAIELARARLGAISARDVSRIRKLRSAALCALITSLGVAADAAGVRRALAALLRK